MPMAKLKASTETITANYQVLSESGDTRYGREGLHRRQRCTLTFAPGETSKTIDVSVMGDTEAEADETLTLKWVAPWTNVLLAAYTATGTIENDDGAVSAALSIADSSADEGKAITFTVTLDNAVPGGFKVTPSFTDGTATQGTDYTANTTALDFAGTAGETVSFTVPTTEDEFAEENETFIVGLTVSGTTHSVTAADTATGTIRNDDEEAVVGASSSTTTVSVSVNTSSVSEGASATTVTVTATVSNFGNIVSTYLNADIGQSADSATEGTDYHRVGEKLIGPVTPASPTATTTFTITPIDDSIYEGDETITARVAVSGGAAGTATITLAENDGAAFTLSASPSRLVEGGNATSVAIRANLPQTRNVATNITLEMSQSGDSATPGTDYVRTPVGNQTLTIPAGQTNASKTYTVTPTDDSVYEGEETITVKGTAQGLTGNNTATATIALVDNDTEDQAPIKLSVSTHVSEEPRIGQPIRLTATATSTSTSARSVSVQVGTGGTATKGTDYKAVSDFTVTIPANQTSGSHDFRLTTIDDAVFEGSETILVSGTNSDEMVKGTTIWLNDNDPLPDGDKVVLSASPMVIHEDAGATSVTVTATTGNPVASDLVVGISTGNLQTFLKPGYASEDDYTLSGGGNGYYRHESITIKTGSTSASTTFTLTPTNDSAKEGSEVVGVAGTYNLLTTNNADITLTDDDASTVTLSASPSSVSESASATTVTVTATADAAVSAATAVTVKVGKTGDSATEGTDYSTVNDFTITIAANATSNTGTFTLTPTQDTNAEGTETITVAGSGTTLNVTGTTVSLTDDDIAVTLSAKPSSVKEGTQSKKVKVTATANNPVSSAKTVTVQVGKSGDSATEGTDYKTVSDFTITIPSGKQSGTGSFVLSETSDTSKSESDETISVSGSGTNMTVTGTTVTLTNDDGTNTSPVTSTLSLSLSPDELTENGQEVSITATVTRSSSSGAASYTVTVTDDGTATADTDYSAGSDATVSIADGSKTGTATIKVTPTHDTLIEGDETVILELKGTTVEATATLKDNDKKPDVNLSLSSSSVSEGASATTVTVTAAFSNSSTYGADKTVTVSVGGSGTATSGTDYSAVSNFDITISKGDTSGTGTFTLTPTSDDVFEGDETIGVAGTSTGLTVNSTTLTLSDDDSAEVTINDASADEGKDMTFTVTLDKAVQGGLKVTLGYTDVTADVDNDYAVNSTAVDFTGTAGETQTFTVSTADDSLDENNETFTVTLTVSKGPSGVTATDTGTGTIIDNDTATVTINDASASEGEDMTFTVTLSTAVAGGLTVTPGFTDDTATEGTDYDENTSALSFTGTKGETKTFTASTTEDTVLEGNETFTVSLTVSDAPDGVTATDTGTGTINDDDSATVTVNDASEAEGSDMTFTVTLDTAVAGGLTVTPNFTDVTATEGTDYDENTTGISFTGNADETQTFTVSTTQDDVVEGDETFTVGLSVSGTTLTSRITSTDTGTGTIQSGSGATRTRRP